MCRLLARLPTKYCLHPQIRRCFQLEFYLILEKHHCASVSYTHLAESSNEDVAIFTLPGRILAVGAGTATITLNANGLSCIYSVTVESDLTDELRATIDGMGENAQNSTNISTRAYTNRGVMANKAKAMAAVQWTPTQNLTKWGGGSFPAGTTVVGIPYTQWAQCSDLDFKSKMNLSDFYSPVNIGRCV